MACRVVLFVMSGRIAASLALIEQWTYFAHSILYKYYVAFLPRLIEGNRKRKLSSRGFIHIPVGSPPFRYTSVDSVLVSFAMKPQTRKLFRSCCYSPRSAYQGQITLLSDSEPWHEVPSVYSVVRSMVLIRFPHKETKEKKVSAAFQITLAHAQLILFSPLVELIFSSSSTFSDRIFSSLLLTRLLPNPLFSCPSPLSPSGLRDLPRSDQYGHRGTRQVLYCREGQHGESRAHSGRCPRLQPSGSGL